MQVLFVFLLGDGGCHVDSKIVIKGSWDSWTSEAPLHFNPATGRFEVSLALTPAVYQVNEDRFIFYFCACAFGTDTREFTLGLQYKFIVDGRWTTQHGRPEVQVSVHARRFLRRHVILNLYSKRPICVNFHIVAGWLWEHEQ